MGETKVSAAASKGRTSALGIALAVTTVSTTARADDLLRMRKSRDVAITIAAGASFLTLELFRGKLLGSACRWCDRAGDGGDGLNRFDHSMRSNLRWGNPDAAALGSNIALYGGLSATLGLGAVAAAIDGKARNIGDDFHVIAQSTLMALTLNSVVKIAFQRQRPYAHAASMSAEGIMPVSEADNVSFFSGHTTLAFSMAVSAGTVASMRDYELAPLVWGVGLTSAAATGYLRVAADEHYMTDVLVGAAVGSLFGFAVPYFLHGKGASHDDIRLSAAPTTGGGVLSFSGGW